MKIILNTSFVTLNDYIDAERSNKYKAAQLKKSQTNKVAFLAGTKGTIKDDPINKDKKHDVKITWFKPNNRQDHDNISFAKKFILDGLQKAGIIKGDSPRYIRNFIDIFEVDKTRDYINCIVEFIEVD
jgi:hypothetical protein